MSKTGLVSSFILAGLVVIVARQAIKLSFEESSEQITASAGKSFDQAPPAHDFTVECNKKTPDPTHGDNWGEEGGIFNESIRDGVVVNSDDWKHYQEVYTLRFPEKACEFVSLETGCNENTPPVVTRTDRGFKVSVGKNGQCAFAPQRDESYKPEQPGISPKP